jgi:MYXO-CTERM domain-containing protein
MIERGLRAAQDDDAGAFDAATIDPSLKTALAAMEKDGVDSDGDGARDLDELSWGGDPNHFDGPPASSVSAPVYGCLVASGKGGHAFAFVVGIAAAIALHRRRRRSA